MKQRRWSFIAIIVVTVLAVAIAIPREDVWLSKLGIKEQLKVRLGLDLQGGSQLVYQADLSKVAAADRTAAMESLTKVLAQRANPGGTSEVNVQTSGNSRVLIECPGTNVCDQNTIGKTANLQFSEVKASTDATQIVPIPTGLSGKDVQRASVDFDPQTGQPIVSLQLKGGEPTKKFSELTTRINQEGSRLLVTLDQDVVFGPATVSNPITDGKAVLQGNFTADQAKKTAQLINAGALPVPVSLVEQRTVGATLGQESIDKSLMAGAVGLIMVALFMILYYRLAGVVAVVALAIYTIITMAIYKLSGTPIAPAPIVLTLAGIAGFVLSIGMAVDANILIFERTKEEYRGGKDFVAAVEAGFDRAWSSIRDSNVSTLITCFILFIFAGSVPIIKGFAVTLAVGVLISMFTAITVSRSLLRAVMRTKWGTNPKLYGYSRQEVGK